MPVWLKRILYNFQFLTRIPVPIALEVTQEDQVKGMALFPVVAAVVGGLCAAGMWAVYGWTGSRMVVSLAGVMLGVYITGGLHLDGLSDVCDGVFSGRDKARMLEIMRDSSMGVFGGAGLFFDLAARWALFYAISAKGFVPLAAAAFAAPILGRLGEVVGALLGSSARQGMGTPYIEGMQPQILYISAALSLLLILIPYRLHALWLLPVSALTAFCAVRFFHKRIGGITGDCLGAINELCEIVFLLMVAGPFFR